MKTLKISEEIHNDLKIYCVINKRKMNEFVEELIKKTLKEINTESNENK